MMIHAFLDNTDGGDRPAISPTPLPRFSPDTESLRVMLIGSAAGITATIHNLHSRGFAKWAIGVPYYPGAKVK